MGATSVYAENTYRIGRSHPMGRNYLRVRGEYTDKSLSGTPVTELPPRTRRIPARQLPARGERGTSSAYAENTLRAFSMTARNWNYLRVRGEYTLALLMYPPVAELPPRTRRIRSGHWRVQERIGTTSAYAENTRLVFTNRRHLWNYLRVRGEYLNELGLYSIMLKNGPKFALESRIYSRIMG